MLKLYHGATSVCSQKARLALFEKQLEWESELLDLPAGDQFRPEYLKLNPAAVVPTLVHDGFVLPESSAIIHYLDGLGDAPKLVLDDPAAAAVTQLWLVRTIGVHEAINSLTFATAIRDAELQRRTPEERERWLNSIPNPQIREKRRDLMKNGPDSVYVDGALHTMRMTLAAMNAALENAAYLTGDAYGLADTALTAYIDRLDRLALHGLWTQTGFDHVAPWLERVRERSSYQGAIADYIPAEAARMQRMSGEKAWPAISKRLN